MRRLQGQKMKNKFHLLHIILFAGFLLLGGSLCILHGQKDFSEMENRTLSLFPRVSYEGIKTGRVQEGFERAMSDQILFRDELVKLSSGIRYALGERMIGEVYISPEGRYLEKITQKDISEKRLNTNISIIDTLSRDMPDVTFSIFLAPTNSVAAKESLPEGAYLYDHVGVAEKIRSDLSEVNVIYEPDTFDAGDYFATDHHWNTYGAKKGAKLYLDSVNRSEAFKDDYTYITAEEPFFGTLYSKAPMWFCKGEDFVYPQVDEGLLVYKNGQDPEEIYDTSFLSKKDKYALYFGGNTGRVDVMNGDANGGDTLLIFKDSYANSAIPYLICGYDRIIMIDLRYYNEPVSKLMKEADPKEILFLYEMSDFCQDENFSKLLK